MCLIGGTSESVTLGANVTKFDTSFIPAKRPVDLAECTRGCVLAIGRVEYWVAEVGEVPQDDEIRFVELSDVTQAGLATMEPALILSPVFTPVFDCVDVAIRLVDAKFTGAYRAMGLRLPKPEMVRREVHAACPNLDFDVVVVEPRRWTKLLG